jgi:hypothetical protein
MLFHDVVAAGEGGLTVRAQVLEELRNVLGPLQLLPGVVHHDHGRAVARPEALGLEQRERAAGIGLARPNVQVAADLLVNRFYE